MKTFPTDRSNTANAHSRIVTGSSGRSAQRVDHGIVVAVASPELRKDPEFGDDYTCIVVTFPGFPDFTPAVFPFLEDAVDFMQTRLITERDRRWAERTVDNQWGD